MDEKKEHSLKRTFLKILLGLIIILTLLVLSIRLVNGSVVSEYGTTGEFVNIDCLGEDNFLYIYAYDTTNTEGRLQYTKECDITLKIKSQLLEQAQKLVIKSDPDEDDVVINYIEYFDKITDNKIAIKTDTFNDKVCFTIELKKYGDIEIANDLTEQVKNYYKCFTKDVLTANAKNKDSYSYVEVYVNKVLKQEYQISKPIEPFRISFTDLSLISDDLKDKLEVKVTNPASNTLKVKVIDTNLNCHTGTFTISDTYKLMCNTSKKIKSYYIQLQDSNNKIYYQDYTIMDLEKKSTTFNKWYLIIAVIIIGLILYNGYSSKVSSKEKRAIDQLDDEIENEKR